MKKKWKVLIAITVPITLGAGVYAGIIYSRRGIVTVQTGRVMRQDLTSVVTASGEVKPRNYINIGANAQGQIVELLVKEGNSVRKGQLLARLESTQPEADLNAQRASLNSSEAESHAAEAGLKAADENLKAMQAVIDRTKADLERARLDFERARELHKNLLIAKQDYDARKAAYEAQRAGLQEVELRLVQGRAQREQTAAQLAAAQKRVAQMGAMVTRYSDNLRRHSAYAPLDGVVTNLPVRVGEIVVPGIQNSAASTIMTIADMSLITAEVKVDETDIVNVKLDQVADVTIDAIPNRTFKGHVIEIGNTAILRSTGVAASQSAISSQEAKDFRVVVALDDPPEEIRPGLSCTSKIMTAARQAVLSVPIQALTVRRRGDLEPQKASTSAQAATVPNPAGEKARKEELQGVFVVSNGKAVFRKVDTGITGATDIEVLGGIQEGDEIITGTYQVIRTLRNEARVKVDNQAPGPKV